MKPAHVDHDEDGEAVMSQKDQDDMERMQSVENLLSLANGDVEGDCAEDEACHDDDANATVDTMALSASDDYQTETHQPQSAIEVEGMKAIRRMRHNNKEKERKDRIKIDYQEIRSLLPESYFSDKKQTTHHDMLQFCLKFMRTLMYQNKLLGGSSCDGLQSDLTVDAEEILRLRKENGELRNEIARYRRIIDSTGIPTNVEPEQLIVSWQLSGGSSDSGTNLNSSGMHQPSTSFFESMMSNASTSQYCDTTMSHPSTSLCQETEMSQQMSSLYADNQSNAGGNCGSDYSLFTDLLNGSNDGAMVPRMAQPSANGLIQCVVQPNVMYHNGPSGMPFANQNGHHAAPNGVQFISQNGMQNNLVATPQMPYVHQGIQQSGMMAAANMPFMQQNGQIVYLSQVPQTTSPATSSVTAAVEMNNTTTLVDSAATVLVQVNNAVSHSTDQITTDEASANAAEIADQMTEQTGTIVDQTNELQALDFPDIDKSEDISTAVNSLTTELLAGETYDSEPSDNTGLVEEPNDINSAVVEGHDDSLADANCLTASDMDTLNIEAQQCVMSNTGTELINSGDAATAEMNSTFVAGQLESISGHNDDVPSSGTSEANADSGVESERVAEVASDCNENQSQHLTSVLESPVSMTSGEDKSTTDSQVFSAVQQDQAEHPIAELQSVQSMPMQPQSFNFDSQQQFMAQAHQFGSHNSQPYGMHQTQPFLNQTAQSFPIPQPQQQFNAQQQQQTQFMQQAQSFITQPQQFMSHAQQFGAQQFTTQQPQQFAMTQQAVSNDPSGQSMQGTLVLHNGQLLLVNSQQPTVPQATHLSNSAPALGTANQAFGMQNPGATNTIFVNQYGGPSAVPPPTPAMSQLTANQTVMVNTPTGPMALNTMPSQPNQHPSALILPNGQIVPVVTQPNLLFPPQQCTPVTGGLLVPSVPNQPVVNYMSSGLNANRMSMLTTNSLSGPIVSLASGSAPGGIVRGVMQYPVGARPTILGASPLMQTVSAQMQVPLRIPTAAVVTAGCTTTMTMATGVTTTGGIRQQLPNLPQTVMATMTAEGTIILTMSGASSSNEQTPTKQASKTKKPSAIQRPLMPKPSTTPKPFKVSDVSSVTTSSPAVSFLTPTRIPVPAPQHQTQQQCTVLPNGFIVNSCPVSVPSMAVSGLTPAAFITQPVHASGMTALSVSVGNEITSAVSVTSVATTTPTCTTDILAKATESIFMLSPSNADHLSPTGLYLGSNDNQLHIDLSTEPPRDQAQQVSNLPAIKPPCKARSRSKKKAKNTSAVVPESCSSTQPVSMAASHIFDELENGDCDDDQTDISDFSDLLRLEPMTPAPPSLHLSMMDGRETLSEKVSSEEERSIAAATDTGIAGRPGTTSLCETGELQSYEIAPEMLSSELKPPAQPLCSESKQVNDSSCPVGGTFNPVKGLDCTTDKNDALLVLSKGNDPNTGNVGLAQPAESDSCVQKSQEKNEINSSLIAELPPVTVDVYSTSSKSLFERFNELLASPPLCSPVSTTASAPSIKPTNTDIDKPLTSCAEVSAANVATTSTATNFSENVSTVTYKCLRKPGKKSVCKSGTKVEGENRHDILADSVTASKASVTIVEQSAKLSCAVADSESCASLISNNESEAVDKTKRPDKSSKKSGNTSNTKDSTQSSSSDSRSKLRKGAPDKSSDDVLSICAVDAALTNAKSVSTEITMDANNSASVRTNKRHKSSREKDSETPSRDTDTAHPRSSKENVLDLPLVDGTSKKTSDNKQKGFALSNFVPETGKSHMTRSCISAKSNETIHLDQPVMLDMPMKMPSAKSSNKRKASLEDDISDELPPVLTAVDPIAVSWLETERVEQRDMMEEATQTTRKELKSVAGDKKAKKQSSKLSVDVPASTVQSGLPETVTFDAHELLNMVDVVENMAVETQTERIRKSHSRKHRSSTSINADGELEMPSKRKKKNRESSRYVDNVLAESEQQVDKAVIVTNLSNSSKSDKHKSTDESHVQRVAMAPKNDPLDVFEFLTEDIVRQDAADLYSPYRNAGKKKVSAETLSDVSSKLLAAVPTPVEKITGSSKLQSGKQMKASEQYDSHVSESNVVKNLADKENQSIMGTIAGRLEECVVEKADESYQNPVSARDDKAIVTSSYKQAHEPSTDSVTSVVEPEGKTFVAARHSNIATLARHVAPPKMHGSTSRSATKQSAQLARARVDCEVNGGSENVNVKSSSPNIKSSDVHGTSGVESRSENKTGPNSRSSREVVTPQDESSVRDSQVVVDSGKNNTVIASAEANCQKKPALIKDDDRQPQSTRERDSATSVKRDKLTLSKESAHVSCTEPLRDSTHSLEKTNVPVVTDRTKPQKTDDMSVSSSNDLGLHDVQPARNKSKVRDTTPDEVTKPTEDIISSRKDSSLQTKHIATTRDHRATSQKDSDQLTDSFAHATKDSIQQSSKETFDLQPLKDNFRVAKDSAVCVTTDVKQTCAKDSYVPPVYGQGSDHKTVTKEPSQRSVQIDSGRSTGAAFPSDFDVSIDTLPAARKLQSDTGYGSNAPTKSHSSDPWTESVPHNAIPKTSSSGSSRSAELHPPSASEASLSRSKYTQPVGDTFTQQTPPMSGHHGNRYQDDAGTLPPGNCSSSNVGKSSSREVAVNNVSPAGSCSKTSISGDKSRTLNENTCLINANAAADRSGTSNRSDYTRKNTAESNCRPVDHGRSYDGSSRERTYGDSCVVENSTRTLAGYGNDTRLSSSSGHVPSAGNNSNTSLRSNCAQKVPTSAVSADARSSRSSGGSQVSNMYGSGGMDCAGATKQRSSCQEEARHHHQQMESSDYFTLRPTSSSSCAVQNLSSGSASIVDPFHYPYPMLNGGGGNGTSTSQHHHDMALASYASSIAADYSLGRNPFYNFPSPFSFDTQPPTSLRCPSGRFSPLSHNLPSCGIEKQSSNKSSSSVSGPVGMSSTGSSVRAGQDSTGSSADMTKSRHHSQHQQQQAVPRDSFTSTPYGHCGGPSSNSQFLEPMSKDSNGGVGSRSAGHRLANSSASTLPSTSRRTRSPAVSGQAGMDQSGSYGSFQGLVNTLTSPPLHHPPPTLPDRHCAANSHTSGSASFDLTSYHSPAAVNQFSPNLTNVGFDPPALNYSSVRDCVSVAQSKKSDKDAKHTSGQTTTLQHKTPSQPPQPKAASRSSSSNKASKKSTSKTAPASSVPASVYDIDAAGMFDSRCMTPYFGLTGGVSPNRGALQAAGASASDSLSYFPSNFFGNAGRPLSNAAKTLQHRHDSNPFNPFSPAGRAAANGLSGLNFQPGPAGFGMDAAHMANPMMSHTPSAHGFGAFGSLFDVGGVSMPDQREALTGLSPMKFGHHGTNSATGISQDSLHHQQSAGSFAYGGRSAAATQHMLHDFNALLGGHHQHHSGFDARTAAAAISGAMGPPFTGHHAAASFGMGALNFPMHNL